MNLAKKKDLCFWRKWHEAGAVKKDKFPRGMLLITGIGINHANGHATLSLGEKVLSSNKDWTVSEPICAVVVKNDWFFLKNYRIGDILPKIPGNAVPVNIFYP